MKLAEIFGINVGVFFENSFNVQFEDRTKNYSSLKENIIDIEIKKPIATVTSIKANNFTYQEEQVVSLMRSFQSIKDADTKRHIAMLIQNLSDENKA